MERPAMRGYFSKYAVKGGEIGLDGRGLLEGEKGDSDGDLETGTCGSNPGILGS